MTATLPKIALLVAGGAALFFWGWTIGKGDGRQEAEPVIRTEPAKHPASERTREEVRTPPVKKPLAKSPVASDRPQPSKADSAELLAKTLEELRAIAGDSPSAEVPQRQLDLMIARAVKLDTEDLGRLLIEIRHSLGGSAIVAGWAALLPKLIRRSDFNLAEWVGALPENMRGDQKFGLVSSAYASRGVLPDRSALDQLSTLMPADAYRTFLSDILRGLAGNNPEKALYLATEHEAEIGGDSLANIYSNLGSKTDFEAIANSPGFASGDESGEIIKGFTKGWTKKDNKEASAWVESLNDVSVRSQAAEALVETWASFDPHAARDWLTKLNGTAGLDGAYSAMAYSLCNSNAEEAGVWARQIGDEAQRNAVLETMKKISEARE